MHKPREAAKIEKWGTGLFENEADVDITRDFSKEPGVAHLTEMLLYPKDIQVARDRLDGVSSRILNIHLPSADSQELASPSNSLNNAHHFDKSPGYRLCIFGAVLMRLGCKLRPDFRQFLEDKHTQVGFSRNSQVQIRHALDVYLDGKPYNFRTKEQPRGFSHTNEWATQEVWGDIGEAHIPMPEDSDPFIKEMARMVFGPMFKNAAAGDNDHPQEACGNCGRKKAPDGSPCHPCSLCGHRRYCSRKCELAHRPRHKMVCDDPFYKVMGNAWEKARASVQRAEEAQLADEGDNSIPNDYGKAWLSGASASPSTSDSKEGREGTVLDAPPTCGGCGTQGIEGKSLQRCQKCRKQHYCGRKCQKAHWPSHKKLCLIWSAA